VRWKFFRRDNEQTEEKRDNLLQDTPRLVRNWENDWQIEWVRAEDGWKILSFGLEVGATRGLPQTAADWFRRYNRERVMSAAIREE
jgi:hypothetical protein